MSVLVLLAASTAQAKSWGDGEWIRLSQGAEMDEEGHDFLARLRRPAYPLWMASQRGDQLGELYWHRLSPTFGAEIREFGEGPVGWLNHRLIEVCSASEWVEVGTGRSVYSSVNLGNPDEARLVVDVSEELVSVSSTAFGNRFVGYRFGGWNLRGVTTDGREGQNERTRAIVEANKASYIESGTWGMEMVVLVRLPLELRWFERLNFQLDVPITYALVGWMTLSDPSVLGLLYAYGGVPRLSVSWDKRLGPVSLGVTGSVPTTLLVLPTQWKGAELTAVAGFFF